MTKKKMIKKYNHKLDVILRKRGQKNNPVMITMLDCVQELLVEIIKDLEHK